MSKKKTTEMSAEQVAAEFSKLDVTAEVGSVATLATPFTEAAVLNGRVHYAGVAAILVAPAAAYLLVMFNPSGNYTPADVGAATSHLRFVLGKQEGNPISVSGHAGNIFGKQCIFMISAS